MLVTGVQRRVQPKVYPYATAHNLLAVHFLANSNSGVDIEEGDNDAAERFQRCPRVDRCVGIDSFPYLDKVRGMEDLGFNEVGDYEGI